MSVADDAKAILGEPRPLIIERCPALTEAIATGLEAGLLPRAACRAVGLRFLDFARFLAVGQLWAEDPPELLTPVQDKRVQRVVLFARAVASSQAVFATRALGQIQDAAQADWRAAAWLLERVQPDDYGRRPTTVAISSTIKPDGETDNRVVIILPDNGRDELPALPAP